MMAAIAHRSLRSDTMHHIHWECWPYMTTPRSTRRWGVLDITHIGVGFSRIRRAACVTTEALGVT